VPRVRATGSIRHRNRAARPALNRRTVTAGSGTTNGPAKRTAAPRPRALTGRATILIVVFVSLALAYTYPLRVYLAQESQIAQLESDQAAQRKLIQAKSEELAKWQDPEYIKARARAKYFYVEPGQTPLLVINDPSVAAKSTATNAPAAAPDSWYDTLWNSVRAADAEPTN
jgi:cell division protein FtsB